MLGWQDSKYHYFFLFVVGVEEISIANEVMYM